MFEEFPVYLPLELERVIFEMSSYTGNGTKHMLSFMLVARYVHDWIKPILYETFLQSPKTKIPDIRRFPAVEVENIGKFCRNLLISEELPPHQTTYLLSLFPNVENLAIWSNRTDLAGIQHGREFQRLPLRRLSVFITDLATINLAGFQSLTHLELIRSRSEPWEAWKPLTTLPRLTHVLINSVIPPEIARNILQHCPNLICLIQLVSVYAVESWHPETRAQLCGGGDNRLVSLSYHSSFHFVNDWQLGVRGGMDTWTHSECIVLARQRKYFTNTQPQWFSNDLDWTRELNKAGWDWYLNL